MKTYKSILIQIVFLLLLSHLSFSQEVEVNLGGNSTSDAFVVRDSSGNVLLKMDGDKNFGINSEQPNGIEINGRSTTAQGEYGDPIKIIGGSSEYRGGGSVSIIGGVSIDGGELGGGSINIASGPGYESGDIDIRTGNASSSHSGTINISTGNGNSSGDINIFTHPANSSGGSISLSTGFGGNITLVTNHQGGVNILAASAMLLSASDDMLLNYSSDIKLNTLYNEFGDNSIWLTVGDGGDKGDPRGIILNPNVGLVEIIGSGTYTGTWTQASDKRYKSNIKPLSDMMNRIWLLQPVEYDWNKEKYPEKNFPGGKQIGLIAQEVEEVFPELVATDKDGYKSVDYSKLSIVLLQAMKEQQSEIEKQSDEINKMKSDIEELKSLILQGANKFTSFINN